MSYFYLPLGIFVLISGSLALEGVVCFTCDVNNATNNSSSPCSSSPSNPLVKANCSTGTDDSVPVCYTRRSGSSGVVLQRGCWEDDSKCDQEVDEGISCCKCDYCNGDHYPTLPLSCQVKAPSATVLCYDVTCPTKHSDCFLRGNKKKVQVKCARGKHCTKELDRRGNVIRGCHNVKKWACPLEHGKSCLMCRNKDLCNTGVKIKNASLILGSAIIIVTKFILSIA